jgi:hypothetical protein
MEQKEACPNCGESISGPGAFHGGGSTGMTMHAHRGRSPTGRGRADGQLRDCRPVLSGPEPFHFETRPRGGSKTSDAAAVALCWLLSAESPLRFYAAASDREQARLLLDALEGFARRSANIAAALTIDRWKVTAVESGASLKGNHHIPPA